MNLLTGWDFYTQMVIFYNNKRLTLTLSIKDENHIKKIYKIPRDGRYYVYKIY